MLFVLNKEKICAYIISVLTVVILFCVTMTIQDKSDNTVPTSANTYTNNTANTTTNKTSY